MFSLNNIKKIFFIGVGGSGMSGIAKILAEMGYQVSGSDQKDSDTIQKLKSIGVCCYIGHAAEQLQGADVVVVSTAIPKDNVERAAAEKQGIPIVHRSDVLAALMDMRSGIAVSGTHGKTTTTSMIANILDSAGQDPSVIVGGMVSEFTGNSRLGKGRYLIAEADESDGSFLNLNPEIAVITNIEADHLDHYGSQEKIDDAFAAFLNKIPEDGMAVVCIDSPGVRRLLDRYDGPCIKYSLNNCKEADVYFSELVYQENVSRGRVIFFGRDLGEICLYVPGEHNMSNALAAICVAGFLNLDFSAAQKALRLFHGVGRRFQETGRIDGIMIVDDYAHHPTEIKATLKAARQKRMNRVIAVFQPHRYTRTFFLLDDFAEAFTDADQVIICDIYSAGEKPIDDISSQILVSRIKQSGKTDINYIPAIDDAVKYLKQIVRHGDLIITLGAGDVWRAGKELLYELENQKYNNM